MAKVYVHNPYDVGTGNWVTLSRIAGYFQRCSSYIECDLFIVLHARRSFQWVVDHPEKPYVLILGGTDINLDVYDKGLRKQVFHVINNATCVVAFMEYMKRDALACVPKAWVEVVPQGLCMEAPVRPCERVVQMLNGSYYVWVGNSREVKDPAYLREAFTYMWEHYNVRLAFVGDGHVKEPWNVCVGMLTRAETFWVMLRSSGLVNTSHCEGMSGAVMEAMELCVPVLCRFNSFSEELLEDGVTGHVFCTESQFMQYAFFRRLRSTCDAARQRVRSLARGEGAKYAEIVRKITGR